MSHERSHQSQLHLRRVGALLRPDGPSGGVKTRLVGAGSGDHGRNSGF